MKKYRYEIILFTVDAISMILELIASRVISPYFGNSNIVWTSVIGIILLSGSIGNYLGGIIADKKETARSLKFVLMVAGLSIFIIPLTQTAILKFISKVVTNIKVGAVFASITLFFIPSFLIGILTPIIMKLKLEDLETAGKTTGRIYAISTIGGIVGTFLGGFFLIPVYGSIHILFVLTIIMFLLVPLVEWKMQSKSNILVVIMILISMFLMVRYMNKNNENGTKVMENQESDAVSYDTQYGRVLIYNDKRGNDNVRVLNIDSGYESIIYTDPEKKNELASTYTKFYDLMFDSNNEIKNTMMIGGAGYAYPRYFISHFPETTMDVVEIDGEITEIAKKYFFLDEFIKDYNIEENHRLNFITADGRTYLNENQKKYDAILNDAFSGNSPAKTLTTVEAVEKIKGSLTEKGLYLTNIISSLEGENSKFLKAEVNTIKNVFKNVYIFPCSTRELNTVQNNLIIATDDEINFKEKYKYDLQIRENELLLTDDYCPVDTLLPER